jgi:pilus assembly protein TadC
MDEILIRELEKELMTNYSESDAKQLLAHVNNFFKNQLDKDELALIVSDIIEMERINEN